MAPLFETSGLTTTFATEDGVVKAVTDVSFTMDSEHTLAVVGESGSGKSVTAMSIMRLLPTAKISGSVVLDGVDLLALPEREMRKVRGNDIAMIFQDPMTALNPVFRIGDQIAEAIRTHNSSVSKKAAWDRAAQLLELVGIPLPKQRVKNFPHEFSGGMRQRAMIAMAISNDPKLLIADEPTTALDVTIQAQVLEVMMEAQKATGAAMMLITHDLGMVAGVADRIQVMYAGEIFESGSTRNIFYENQNPYTRGLIASIPRLNEQTAGRLYTIPGAPPSLIFLPRGCAFRPRCEFATEICLAEEPMLRSLDGDGRRTRCHNAETLPDPVLAGPTELPTWST
jgi:oligopeptide/dipeptide ABC transporter ATP-binding protein